MASMSKWMVSVYDGDEGWLHHFAKGAKEGFCLCMEQSKDPQVCCRKMGVIGTAAASGAQVALAIPVVLLPPLLSQSGHVPGPKDSGVDMGVSLAMRPRRSGWPRDSSLIGASVVVGGDGVGGSLPSTLDSWTSWKHSV